MKKTMIVVCGVFLGLLAFAAAVTLFIQKADCPYCRKVRALFNDKDFTIIPMKNRENEE